MSKQLNAPGGPHDPVKEATIVALAKILEPLIELMLDAGVTVQDLNRIARKEAVRIASRRVVKSFGRESKSRVAILTGLPRSEITKILRIRRSSVRSNPSHHAGRRVLSGWHEDSKYLGVDGTPAVLPIFGRKASFEKLVGQYGAGIPVRAMLDELTQSNAIDHLENQKVRVKTRVPILTGLSSRTISAMGDRGSDLLRTLGHNLRTTTQPLFESTAVADLGDTRMSAIVRREIAEQGENFINAANSLFSRAKIKATSRHGNSGNPCRVGITMYYFQDEIATGVGSSAGESITRRKNLRRRPI